MDKSGKEKTNLPVRLKDEFGQRSLAKLERADLIPLRDAARGDLDKINDKNVNVNAAMLTAARYVAFGAAYAAVLGGSPLLWGVAIPMIFAGWALEKERNSRLKQDVDTIKHVAGSGFYGPVREIIRLEQRACYEGKKHEMVRLADEQLAGGGLIGEEALPFLATLTPDKLGKASDDLAITVLQIRSMIALIRFPLAVDAEDRPMTMRRLAREYNLAVQPGNKKHQKLLREKLERQAVSLREDKFPAAAAVLPDLDAYRDRQIDMKALEELEPTEKKKKSFGGWLLWGFRDGYLPFLEHRKQKKLAALAKAVEFPDDIEFEVPALRTVDELADMLARYEAEVEPLDLPAIRGWGKASKPVLPARHNGPRPPI